MKVLADTNVILDILLKREPHFTASYTVLDLAAQGKIKVLLTASCVTDIHYLLRRSGLDPTAAKTALLQLLTIIELADVRPVDIERALYSKMTDFEDALVAEVADRTQCSHIITRNIKDFSDAKVPALTPLDFIAHQDFAINP